MKNSKLTRMLHVSLKLSKSATLEKKETSFCSHIRMKREHFEKNISINFL